MSCSRQIHDAYGGTFCVGLKRPGEPDDQKHDEYMFNKSFLILACFSFAEMVRGQRVILNHLCFEEERRK